MGDPASEYAATSAALQSKIIILRERIHMMYAEATSVGARPSGEGGRTAPSDRVGRQVSKIVDAERELQRLVDAKDDLDTAMISLIDTISVPEERTVLTLRVVYGYSHGKTAQGAGLSDRTEFRVYKKGLHHLKRKTKTDQYTRLKKVGSNWQSLSLNGSQEGC